MNMACGPSGFTTEYVPLQYFLSLFWRYNRKHPAAICLMAKYVPWLVWGYNRICPAAICLVACLRLQPNMSRCNMSRGSSEVTTEYVPLQYVSLLVWCYNRIHPAAICLMAKYGSWLVWGYNRICPAAICFVACLRLQPNMSRCNMSRCSSDVTTENIPLQYVSWLNMSRGLSEVTTEYVPLQYVSLLVWCYNRICPAAISLVVCLRLQPNMSRCNMSRGSADVATKYIPLQYVSHFFALLTYVPHLH